MDILERAVTAHEYLASVVLLEQQVQFPGAVAEAALVLRDVGSVFLRIAIGLRIGAEWPIRVLGEVADRRPETLFFPIEVTDRIERVADTEQQLALDPEVFLGVPAFLD